MKWNKLEARELTKEEKEIFRYKSMWEGPVPEPYEDVLVTFPLASGGFIDTYVDTWTEFDNGVGFEYTDENVIYWMEIPKYNGELDD